MSEEKKQEAKILVNQNISVDVKVGSICYSFSMPLGGNWEHAIQAAEACLEEVKLQYEEVKKQKKEQQKKLEEQAKKEENCEDGKCKE